MNQTKNKNAISGVTPFTYFYFQDCLYNSLFSILNYYNRTILPFILNTQMIFSKSKKNILNLSFDYSNNKSLSNILENLELNLETYLDNELLLKNIKDAIDENALVIVNVDCYYEVIRKDTFMKEHLDHNLLVYGYDDTKVLVYEHSNSNTLNYKPVEIDYDNLKKANNGFCTRYLIDKQQQFSYCKINKNKEYKLANDNINNNCILEYSIIFLDNQGNEKLSLDNLCSTLNKLSEIMNDDTLLKENTNNVLEVINDVINVKKLQHYLFKFFSKNLQDIADDLTKYWAFIRLFIVKIVNQLQINNDEYKHVFDVIIKIKDKETKLHNMLIDYCRSIVSS